MPTYDYACAKCGHRFEQVQSMKDAALSTCPKCKAKKLERLIGTGGAVIFKGSGFYQTDYRSASYDAAKKADAPKSDAPKTDAPSGGGCDKPACGTGGCASPPSADKASKN
jgi:putative FmdB family regulatory protein